MQHNSNFQFLSHRGGGDFFTVVYLILFGVPLSLACASFRACQVAVARLLNDPGPAFGICMTSLLALVTILVVIYAPGPARPLKLLGAQATIHQQCNLDQPFSPHSVTVMPTYKQRVDS